MRFTGTTYFGTMRTLFKVLGRCLLSALIQAFYSVSSFYSFPWIFSLPFLSSHLLVRLKKILTTMTLTQEVQIKKFLTDFHCTFHMHIIEKASFNFLLFFVTSARFQITLLLFCFCVFVVVDIRCCCYQRSITRIILKIQTKRKAHCLWTLSALINSLEISHRALLKMCGWVENFHKCFAIANLLLSLSSFFFGARLFN